MINAHRDVPGTERRRSPASNFGRGWTALATALALHVTDEALTDFLPFYNSTVRAIQERLPWLSLPTFSFQEWIGGLAALIAVLFALSPFAFRGARWMVVVAMPFSALMVANGLGHIGSSVYMGRFMPGVYSSPVLIAASLLTLAAALRLLRHQNMKAQNSPDEGRSHALR